MNLDELKDKGYKIVTNWQECNKKTIFLFNSSNNSKFINYKQLAINKNCKFFICNIRFKKDIKNNTLYVCQGNDNSLLFTNTIYLKNLHITDNNEETILKNSLKCQIRHQGEKYICNISKIDNEKYLVNINQPIRAAAPGQSLVLFENDVCLGGGIISDDKHY